MEQNCVRARLADKLHTCWADYYKSLLRLTPEQLIEKASEISAARFCFEDLTQNMSFCSEHLLEHLLQFDNPLGALRDQWMEGQREKHSDDMEYALWELWDHGSRPNQALL